ncbi:HpcH/HpaI aldolase family protein [Paenibacillus sp.]|uniref:HpcH/HpaI aldolase family protein n=1 Tax=Paenibacillus sp. TaxID=58172 RepID=UPI002D28D22C|nr:aldolase/citrate lyase family protein [Paenibacillus sp.]HZG56236.1 aldolase/citrate lyase family protein [Paenibacillus sp.]
MMRNGWKERLIEEPLIGCFATFPSSSLTEYIASMGFDFILIDNEHGAIDQGIQEDMIRAAHCAGVPAVARVPRNRPEYIQKALDSGANGVQVPMTNTRREVEEVVRSALFPPAGHRGVAFLPRAAAYGLHPDKADYLARSNREGVVTVHVETVEAVANLDDMLETEGADVYFVGPGDLAISMGYAHHPNHPEVLSVIEKCIRTIAARGKIAGTYVGTAERTRLAIEWGAHYLVTAVTPAMAEWSRQFLSQVKGGGNRA